jgi:hypothetical protein
MLVPLHRRDFEPQLLDSKTMALLIVLSSDSDRVALMEMELKEIPIYKMMVLRAKALGIELERPLRIFLITVVETPAALSLYLHSLWHIAQENKSSRITLDQFLMAFGEGFPSDDAVDEAWVAQKDNLKNLVDMDYQYEVNHG